MKKKINFQQMAIATVAIFVTFILVSAIFYDIYQKQIITDLKTLATILNSTAKQDEIEKSILESLSQQQIRVTFIDNDGNVIYDSKSINIKEMDNHHNRPEIIDAYECGEGFSVRKSSTIGKSSFYYAKRLEDGCIIRVSKEAGSMYSIYFNALPVIILMIVLLLVISFIASHLLTKRLVKPIKELAEHMDREGDFTTYDELKPFITTIQEQHENIMKNALVRQEFTANVSHELKTPLTSISGYAELIETGMASDDDIHRFAGEIHKNSNRLLTLINDIIRLSELDGTQQEEMNESINLFLAAQTCADMLSFSAEKHHVSLNISGDSCYVYGNRQMLDELLYNLCDNAIRYNNDGGSVRISVTEQKKSVCLCVTDTGIGIPKEAQERIFERFYRVDKSRSKQTGGTGLGLAIVKHIITKMHAHLSVESEVGIGTKVTVLFQKEEKNY